MYTYKEGSSGASARLLRDPQDIRAEAEGLQSNLREVREHLGCLSAAYEELTDAITEGGDNQSIALLIEILTDGIEEAESEARALLSELSRLQEELLDSLWLLTPKEEFV